MSIPDIGAYYIDHELSEKMGLDRDRKSDQPVKLIRKKLTYM